jgi:spore germination protein GerM
MIVEHREYRSTCPPRRGVLIILLAVLLIPVLAACGGNDETANNGNPTVAPATSTRATTAPSSTATAPLASTSTPSSTATQTVPPATPTASTPAATADSQPQTPMLTLSVYFLRDGKVATAHRTIEKTLQVAEASMQALIAGPTDAETAAGLTSALPEGTRYLGTAIEESMATVDLSANIPDTADPAIVREWMAQVVYTLTQFPTVTSVKIALNGQPIESVPGLNIDLAQPLTRATFEQETPWIFVETPAVGDTISSPLRLTGTANTFEATFNATLLDAGGNVVAEEVVMATSGTGTRGTFDVTIPFTAPAGAATVMVFESSAKDGSPTHVVKIPVVVRE